MNHWAIQSQYDQLIMKLNPELRVRIQVRRVSWLTKIDCPHVCKYTISTDNNRLTMLQWIDTHTSGPFYLGGDLVAFEDDADAVMFKLGFK